MKNNIRVFYFFVNTKNKEILTNFILAFIQVIKVFFIKKIIKIRLYWFKCIT